MGYRIRLMYYREDKDIPEFFEKKLGKESGVFENEDEDIDVYDSRLDDPLHGTAHLTTREWELKAEGLDDAVLGIIRDWPEIGSPRVVFVDDGSNLIYVFDFRDYAKRQLRIALDELAEKSDEADLLDETIRKIKDVIMKEELGE